MRLPSSRPAKALGVLAGACALVAASVMGAGAVVSSPRADHPRRVPPVALSAPARLQPRAAMPRSSQASTPQEFSTTANPISLDPPLAVPRTKPIAVTIANNAAFGNGPPPSTSTVTLPTGRFSAVVLDITGTEQGRQYDRLCEVFAGATEIFLGVTPEPTPQGITWHVQKNVTGYLPLLSGTQTFSTYVDNYLSSIDTGIPTITAKLLFYPAGGGFDPAHPAAPSSPALAGDAIDETGPASPVSSPGIPTNIVPLLPSGATNTLNTIGSGQTSSSTVTLPSDVDLATLDLYAIGQSTDEFWWSLTPAFREVEVSIDGKPAGAVWPFPYVYTGGVNPLIWRPLTAIHTLDIPSYRIDLTPFAGLLAGTHTITLTVAGNAGYWLAGGSLLVSTGRSTTTGKLLSDTLTFPSTSTVTTQNALGSTNQPVTAESASKSYEISGQVNEGRQQFTDTIDQSLQFENDQSYINPSCSGPCYQWVHSEETQSTTENLSGAAGTVSRSDRSSWTIDAPNGYLQSSDGSDFFLPASVSQQLTDVAQQQGGWIGQFTASLLESIIGYGALEEDNSTPTITNGDTTGTISYHTSGGGAIEHYARSIVTSGGQVVQSVGG